MRVTNHYFKSLVNEDHLTPKWHLTLTSKTLFATNAKSIHVCFFFFNVIITCFWKWFVQRVIRAKSLSRAKKLFFPDWKHLFHVKFSQIHLQAKKRKNLWKSKAKKKAWNLFVFLNNFASRKKKRKMNACSSTDCFHPLILDVLKNFLLFCERMKLWTQKN